MVRLVVQAVVAMVLLAAAPVDRVAPQEVKRLQESGSDLVLVDTRSEKAFARGHIAGALSLPWQQTMGEPVDLPRTRLLVLYCDCSDEETSLAVARQLTDEWGFTQVKVLRSGLAGWIELGYPMEGNPAGGIRCITAPAGGDP